VRFKESTCL